MSSEIVLATINAKWIHPSLALRLLKANLGSLSDKAVILEFALRQPLSEKTTAILSAKPRLLGLSVSIWNHTATLELLKALDREWDPASGSMRPVIVLGGPEVSWLPEDAKIFRYADYVIRGEGEESFCSLCHESFCQTKKTVFINQGYTTVDMNDITTAYRFYTDEDIRKKFIYVESSRGCPFNCVFCQAGEQKIREFPLEPFLADIKALIDRAGPGVCNFKFLDRTFNLNMDRVEKILMFFLEQIKQGCSFCVHFEMFPSIFPPDLKKLLASFPPGFLRVEIGIQTLNPEVSSLIKRPPPVLESIEFLRKETDAIVHADLIAGLPGEDLASFRSGFDRLWELMSHTTLVPFEIQLGILKGLPGTSISRHKEPHMMSFSGKPPYELIETDVLPAAELDRIKNFARFWETIVNRNHFPDLIPSLLPVGESAFDCFMNLSDRLFGHFGKNWGIGREDLRQYLCNYLAGP